jgi:small ligand-binding sensory domain FIST
MTAEAAIAHAADWREALADVVARVKAVRGESTDLAFLFASAQYAEDFPELVRAAQTALGVGRLLGCSGQGIIGAEREIEGEPALSLLALSLPGALLHAAHLTQADVQMAATPRAWWEMTDVPPDRVKAWFVLADPFTLDAEALINALSSAYPDTPIAGGLASGDPHARRTHLFLDDRIYAEGAILMAFGGPYTVRTVVSQGATPIGQTWTVTEAEGQFIRTIAQRPAYEVLMETLSELPEETRHRAQSNLLVGLAMDEYRDEFQRGDFLIRNLMGYDPDSGSLAIGAMAHVGQTVQFQLRDPQAADEDLRALLLAAKEELGRREPLGALLCSCNGRGVGMFGAPDHDARAVAEVLGDVPLAGFFCNGEIGPVGSRPYLHGFTASLALILPDGC